MQLKKELNDISQYRKFELFDHKDHFSFQLNFFLEFSNLGGFVSCWCFGIVIESKRGSWRSFTVSFLSPFFS